MRRKVTPLWLLLALAVAASTAACHDGESQLRAKVIESQRELIGGPGAKGKLGDFLLENDKIRVVVAGKGATWAAGIFGGTLIDLDLQRKEGEYAYGNGRDAFAETFPLLNLVVVNPDADLRRVVNDENGVFRVELAEPDILVLKDGSDGAEAVVRVQGSGGYMFDVFKFLHMDFLRSFVDESLDLGALLPEEYLGFLDILKVPQQVYIPALLATLPELAPLIGPVLSLPQDAVDLLVGLRIHLYRLLARLHFDFDFQTDYVLEPGKRYVTIRTTIRIAPPSQADMAKICPQIACDLDCSEYGYVMEEVLADCDPPDRCKLPDDALGGIAVGTQDAAFCPICECAEERQMPALTESRSVFNDIIGSDPASWTDPLWRSGLVAGDFLFFGGEMNIFSPGLGFDENRKIFENMWQQVGTVGNPIVMDWLAAVADDAGVSYAFVTKSESPRVGEQWASCETHRFALVWADPTRSEAVVSTLHDTLGRVEGIARAAVRGLTIDRTPLPLESFDTTAMITAGATTGSWDDFRAAALASPRAQLLATLFGSAAELDVLPAADCQPSRLLIPLFTTSATAVMTHEQLSDLELKGDGSGTVVDAGRVFSYERFLVVGNGDVGSLMDTVLELRGEPYGRVKGAVLESGTLLPLTHTDVFALRDPRPVIDTLSLARKARLPDRPTDLAEWTYELLTAVNKEVFGDAGLASQMKTDPFDDPVKDGAFSGAIAPGDYLLVAKGHDRAASRPVPVRVTAGQSAVANLLLEPPATVAFRVTDEQGAVVPAKLTFVTLDPDTLEPLRWDGANHVELGDHRAQYGVREVVHVPYGHGEATLEPGVYRVYASLGVEYDIDVAEEVHLHAGKVTNLTFSLTHSVATEGWIAGDFHMHARPSVDSGLRLDDRVISNVTEGVEFVTSSDHDVITDYRPILNLLDLYHKIGFQMGAETSPIEFGHYNVYPLAYDDTLKEVHDPPPWQFRRLGEVFRGMRERGLDGPEGTVVQINHPRDGFSGVLSQLGLDGLTLERSTPGLEMCNPSTVDISCDFDAIEVMNEKRFELIRTPTIWEIEAYNACLVTLIAAEADTAFSVAAPDTSSFPIDLDASLCGDLQAPIEGCKGMVDPTTDATLDDAARAEALILWDHCRWHDAFRAEMARAAEETDLIERKRVALEGLKMLMERYMFERTPAEQEALAFFREHPEWAPECNFAAAMAGCAERRDADDKLLVGCAEDASSAPADCGCHLCVCGTEDAPGLMPACCTALDDPDNPGTGWTAECAAVCRDDCHGCGVQPCLDNFQVLDDWMGFLNQGFVVTAVGNSDSHDTFYEAGIPRNFVWVGEGEDDPAHVKLRDVNQAILDHRVVLSSGPFVEFTLDGAAIGDTLSAAGATLEAHIRVQTPRWFDVDRVELYRNGRLERLLWTHSVPEDVVDADVTLTLDRPVVDSWYAVVAYGFNEDATMEPVYHGLPYGKILLPSILALAMEQLLAPFEDLLSSFSSFFDVTSLLGGTELPDSFPVLPFALTNPIWVDLDGDGFDAPNAPDWDGDGTPDLPGFCSQPCALTTDAAGMVVEAQSTCPMGQVCIDDGTAADAGRCAIPISANCYDGDWANDLSIHQAPLTAEGAPPAPAGDAGLSARDRRTRQFEALLRAHLERGVAPRERTSFGSRRAPPAP